MSRDSDPLRIPVGVRQRCAPSPQDQMLLAASRVGAIFDLDGTLLPEPSLERRFFAQLRRNAAIPFTNYLRWSIEACRLLPRGLDAVRHGNKRYLTGINSNLACSQLESISFFEEGIDRIVWHAKQNHEIVLLSGTLEPLARLAAMALDRELQSRGIRIHPWVCATQLAESRGCWTGRLIGEAVSGPAKARAIENLARAAHLDLRHCHAYANALLDRHLLCAVGHGHAVNPGRALAALANEKDWPIWYWHCEKQIPVRENAPFAAHISQLEEPA